MAIQLNTTIAMNKDGLNKDGQNKARQNKNGPNSSKYSFSA